jgi:hypothetical protein
MLADEHELGRRTQVLAALRELDAGALVLVSSLVERNAWEAEIALTSGLSVDRTPAGIFPLACSVRMTTATEILRRKLSPKAAPRRGSVLVIDGGQTISLSHPSSRFRVKLARLADAFVRADGAVWLLVDPDHADSARLYDLLETVGFMLRRRMMYVPRLSNDPRGALALAARVFVAKAIQAAAADTCRIKVKRKTGNGG